MRFNPFILTSEDETNVLSQPRATSDAIATARARIVRDFSALFEQQPRLLHLALNEAEAMAWQTGFPELVFPLLAQEKANNIASWYERQQFVRRSVPIQAFAA